MGSDVMGSALCSPLGAPHDVASMRERFPALAGTIDELESVLTPEFDRADRRSIEAQAAMKRERIRELVGGTVVGVLAIIRLGFGDSLRWAGLASAVIAATIAVIAAVSRGAQLDEWLDNRRVAEELRSLYFRWIAHTGSTAADPAGTDRGQLRRMVSRITDTDDAGAPPSGSSLSDEADPMRYGISDPAWSLYREARLEDQLRWLQSKSRSVKARSQALGRVQVAVMVAATLCGLLSGLLTGSAGRALAIPVAASAALIGLFATIDSITASERLAEHYTRAAQRLDVIRRGVGDLTGTQEDVEEIERILTAEHRSWHRLTKGNQQ